MFVLCLFAHSLLIYKAFASEAQQPVVLGADATLRCRAPGDAVVTVLEWSKADLRSDDYVFFYRNDRPYEKYQHRAFRGRVELLEPTMKDGDTSILLKNVTFSDAGTYRCRMITSSTGSSQRVVSEETSLSVTESDPAEPGTPAVGHLEKAVQNQDAESGTYIAVGVGAVGVLAAAAAAAFVIIRKRKMCSKKYHSPGEPEEPDRSFSKDAALEPVWEQNPAKIRA